MKNLHGILIVFAYIFSASCQPSQNLEKASDKVIVFGNGGGFSGQEKEYYLDFNGSLKMKESFKSETTQLTSLKRSRVKKLFKQLDVIQLDTINVKHPGNMYFFIRYKYSGKVHEVVWGDPQYPVLPEIKQFYESLISATK
jgi:hypothetical protein